VGKKSWYRDSRVVAKHFDGDAKKRATADQHKANIAKYNAPTWYECVAQHWGTKWNACYVDVSDNGDGSRHVSFETAWDFPRPVFEKLVADFPTLIFEGSAQEPNMATALPDDLCRTQPVRSPRLSPPRCRVIPPAAAKLEIVFVLYDIVLGFGRR
jgi:hypothetical protein